MKLGVVSRIGEFPQEFWENEFSTFKGKATHLELIVNYPFLGPLTYQPEQLEELKKLALKNKLELILHLLPNQYHLPEGIKYSESPKKFQKHEKYLKDKVFNISSADENIRKFSVEEIKRTIDMAETLGARLITIHGGSFSSENYKDYLLRARKSLEYINSISGRVKICVENLPTLGHSGKPPKELPIYANDLVYLVSGLDNIGICFDIGHANTVESPLKFYETIRKTGKVWNMHLHDNEGERDSHIQIRKGNINFREFFEELKKEKYSGFLGIELDTWNEFPELMKVEERISALEYLKK